MDVTHFENRRWTTDTQKVEFRHRAALELIENGTVLDVGCGDGLLLSLLKEKGVTAEGIDISEEAVKRCVERGFTARTYDPNAPFPFPDDAFDTVVMLDVLEHVYAPEELLREAKRVARTHVIVGVPNFSSLPARLQVLGGSVPENNLPLKGHVYWFNYQVLSDLARECGLAISTLKTNTFSPFSTIWPGAPASFPNLLALSFVIKLESES